MLLEFRCSNFRSFKNEFVFSMKPSAQKGLDYSIQEVKIDNKTYKTLSSAVIYGPNASGKTNVILAMDALKKIIERGNINNVNASTPNFTSNNLELIPNYNIKEPTAFYIQFVADEMLFEYSLTIDLGDFLNTNYSRKVIKEELKVNHKRIFLRDCSRLQVEEKTYSYDPNVQKVFKNAENIAAMSLNETELFLTNGYKSIFSAKLVEKITTWFNKKFIIILRADSIQTKPLISDMKKDAIYVDEFLSKALNEMGLSNNVAYKMSEDGNPSLVSLVGEKEEQKRVNVLPADFFESYGTIRFIYEFPLIINAVTNGGTLVVDEFDASLHPVALMSIINIFHNDEINKKHAQLIFNTHNPIFLNHSLFRRDEIKFVEFDKENKTSITYSLSDFNTSKTTGTRGNSDYMKNYFENRYGAVPDVDFSEVFSQIMNDSQEEEQGES